MAWFRRVARTVIASNWQGSGHVAHLDYDFGGADTVLVNLTDGIHVVEVMADVELGSRTAVLHGLHIPGGGRNPLGPRALRELIIWAKAQLDVDHLRIEGAARTSGAGPGRIPSPLVF